MKLSIDKRSQIGRRPARRLRREGRLPAVIYGRGQVSTPVSLDQHAFEMAVRGGEHTIEATLDGNEEMYLIQEIQLDALGDHILHVDLRKVARDQKVTIWVAVNGYGHPAGGILDHAMAEIEIECFPHQIPDKIEIPVGGMKVGEVIRVKDVPLPEGVVAISDPEQPIFALHAPRGEEEMAAAAEGPIEPERIGEKKEEEEG